jgi:hypothetical protein
VISNSAIEFGQVLPLIENRLRRIDIQLDDRQTEEALCLADQEVANFPHVERLWSKMSKEEREPFLEKWRVVRCSLRRFKSGYISRTLGPVIVEVLIG